MKLNEKSNYFPFYRAFFVNVFALNVILTSACKASMDVSIIGSWNCLLQDTKEKITFYKNNTYVKTAYIYGILELTDKGYWDIKEGILHLKSESHIAKDLDSRKEETKISNNEFNLVIVELSAEFLVTSNIDILGSKNIRNCQRYDNHEVN